MIHSFKMYIRCDIEKAGRYKIVTLNVLTIQHRYYSSQLLLTRVCIRYKITDDAHDISENLITIIISQYRYYVVILRSPNSEFSFINLSSLLITQPSSSL